MNPGPELDAVVAEKVEGKRLVPWLLGPNKGSLGMSEDEPSIRSDPALGKLSPPTDLYRTVEIPKYSTDIAAAWPLLKKVQSGLGVGIHVVGTLVSVEIPTGSGETFRTNCAEGNDIAHVICLAALKASGVQVSNPDALRIDP